MSSKRSWFTVEEEEPLEEYGTRPENRTMKELIEKGIVLVDKPFGPTSNQVTEWVEDLLNRKKAGHFGTLDPNASGVLPIGLDKATRIHRIVSGSDKEYVFEARLGQEFEKTKVQTRLRSFYGKNTQVPPEKSAVKREKREREVYEIELLDKQGKNILGRVECESGFYVRVLINQLGEKLGTDAEMTELRRTRVGEIHEDDAYTLQELVDNYHFWKNGSNHKLNQIVKPIEFGVRKLPKVVLKNSAVNSVANGSNLGVLGISKLQDGISEGDQIALMTLKGELVSVARAEMSSQEMYEKTEGTAADLESVHMDPSTYPKRWKQ